jgi:uroporphyrinogen-III decarboxylase
MVLGHLHFPAGRKPLLGDRVCIAGNVPASLLVVGNPDQMRAYCKNLIDKAAKGGGFILGLGTSPENMKTENLRALLWSISPRNTAGTRRTMARKENPGG